MTAYWPCNAIFSHFKSAVSALLRSWPDISLDQNSKKRIMTSGSSTHQNGKFAEIVARRNCSQTIDSNIMSNSPWKEKTSVNLSKLNFSLYNAYRLLRRLRNINLRKCVPVEAHKLLSRKLCMESARHPAPSPVLEISDVGLMNKATRIARHKAGIGVEQGMCYVLDQTDEGYHPHRVSIYTKRKCGCI